jgi:carboxypeptidase T
MPYMSVAALDAAVDHITTTYPAIAAPVALPEASVEGRAIKALKIGTTTSTERPAVIFLGGTHARELINPETVVGFALRLCDAFVNNTGLAFGPKTYDPSSVQSIVKTLDLVLLPLVNPDGRAFCLAPGGFPMWRKNRSNHPGHTCRGVDLNRNCDFLWSSGIGTSADSCNDVYKGPAAFSEPESRNVRWLIDNFPNATCMVDIHSYSELMLFPWGDDENQTTDPNQNFLNPAFDGQRGIVGSGYKEYIPAADQEAHLTLGRRVRDGIAAVRGRVYTVQQSIALYPTTATIHDYAYARHFVDTGRRRILGFTLETAREFQPADAEKNQVITEVSAGLMECLLETLCPAEVVQALLDALFPLESMRKFRNARMLTTASGRRYARLLRTHSRELVHLLGTDRTVLEAGSVLLKVAGRLLTNDRDGELPKIGADDLAEASAAVRIFHERASPSLQADLTTLLGEMQLFEGRRLHDVLSRRRTPTRRPPRGSRTGPRN